MSAPYDGCKCNTCRIDLCEEGCEFRLYDECFECTYVPDEYKTCEKYVGAER